MNNKVKAFIMTIAIITAVGIVAYLTSLFFCFLIWLLMNYFFMTMCISGLAIVAWIVGWLFYAIYQTCLEELNKPKSSKEDEIKQ